MPLLRLSRASNPAWLRCLHQHSYLNLPSLKPRRLRCTLFKRRKVTDSLP
uniref:Uncharacterized protein n=1 Tax=Siphoviridae sp. ct6bU4 TaxID=2825344 RepID=A0A8S5VAC7_9CAUD|nr:MAG TPA: hypothetical protein [Siphoviridae sp. ct6bU4]